MPKTALNEVVAPPEVDTLRDDICPVCGEVDSYNGDKCMVCNFEKPPSMFMDPDTQVAQNMDFRQDQQQDGVGGEPGDLQCPVCQQVFSSAEALDADQDPHFAPAAEQEPAADDAMGINPEEPEEEMEDLGEEPPVEEESGSPFGQTEPQEDSSPNGPPDPEEEEDPNAPPAEDETPVSDSAPDPNAAEDPDAIAEEMDQEQYSHDQDVESQTGYEAGDVCPNCGQGVLAPIAADPQGGMGDPTQGGDPALEQGGEGPNPPIEGEDSGGDSQTPIPGGNDDEEESDSESPSDDSPNDDEEEDDEDGDDEDSEFVKKQTQLQSVSTASEGVQSTMAPRPTQPAKKAPVPQARHALHTALNQQSKVLQQTVAAAAQDRALRLAAEARLTTLESMFLRLASLVGADEDAQLRSINEEGFKTFASFHNKAAKIHTADQRDPAQPVPEPPAQPPVVTEQEAAQPAARADVTQLGATPITDVSADASVAVDQPYGTIAFEPLNLNEVDVTAPVQNTQGHLPPEQTIIPVEVRVGDPDDPQPAFGWTLDGGNPAGQTGGSVGSGGPSQVAPGSPAGVAPNTRASKDSGRYASLRLARLRIQAGIAPNADDITVAASIDENPDMTSDRIDTEIATLSSVLNAPQNQQISAQGRTASRRLVPRSTQPAPAPSLSAPPEGSGPIQASASLGQVSEDEMLFE